MARNKKEEAPPRTDGWMNTFADLMNLLLCFFVMLFAMSTIDSDKFQQIIASFNSNYTVLESGSPGMTEGMLIATGASQLTEISQEYSEMTSEGNNENADNIENAMDILDQAELVESEQMADKIEDMINKAGKTDAIEVQVTQHYVCLNMKGALLFQSASADLTEEAKDVLSEVASILKLYEDNLIEIEGHTDNIPIVHELYKSNDILSVYRALSVFQYLVEEGVNPTNLKHSGRGEYDPIASNDTAEGRAQNRRVEIKIYNSYNSPK